MAGSGQNEPTTLERLSNPSEKWAASLSATKETQRNNILAKLIAAKGKEVPLPEIASCAAQYQSRLFELRRMGYRIPAPRMETVNGQRRTWYRLECGPHS